MNPPAVQENLAPLLERCFLFAAAEASYEITGISGSLPKWLRGSYYVNGPARFERAGKQYNHWLDGDGMVCSLHFTEGGVRFVSRFVQTTKLKQEEKAGRFLYRQFGTAFPGDGLRRGLMLEPPNNVSVYRWGRRLLAFGEQSLPIELDPDTLETIGDFDFGGKVNEVSPFAAHAKIDPANGHLLNFGVAFSAKQPMLHVYEFGADGALISRRRYPLEMQHSNHDFGLTSNHVVFYLSPLIMNFDRFWREGASVMESLSWEPERGARILVAPRAGKPGEPFTVQAGDKYSLHFINCHEDGSLLIADVLELDAPVYDQYQPIPDLFQNAPRCRPVRFVIDVERREIVERFAMAYDPSSDFAAIDPLRLSRNYSDFWLLGISKTGLPGRKFFDQLAHGTWPASQQGSSQRSHDSWQSGSVNDAFQVPTGEYLGGEPAFAGNPENPREGVVIVEHLNARTDEAVFLVFDSAAVRNGPIARLPLKHRLHPGFHSTFHPA